MNYIAIENAANGASVALLAEEQEPTIFYRSTTEEGKNAEQVLPMLDDLLLAAGLNKQDIHGVIFSQGPGGFTGLRVACGLAQGLALGLNIPVMPVSSLEATATMSLEKCQDGLIIVALDARMKEVYLAVYRVKNGRLLSPEVLTPTLMQATDVLAWVNQQLPRWCLLQGLLPSTVQLCLAGNAVLAYPEAFDYSVLANQTQWCVGSTAWANADSLLPVGVPRLKKQGGVPLENLSPLYLRDKVAFTTVERESGLGGNPQIALPELSATEKAIDEIAHILQQKSYWIRPLKMSDLPAVMAIEEKAHITPWTEGMFIASFMHVQYRMWALVDTQDAILAYAVQLIDPDVVHLMTIAVAPSLQGQGLGSLLLRWLDAYIAQQTHIPKVQLLEVRDSNAAARHLYERYGYQQIGRRKAYYTTSDGQKEDALVMEKQLISVDRQ